MTKRLAILGIRGIPARHGGFETFAEHLALYLHKRGWKITVYCQTEGHGPANSDVWKGIHRVHIPVRQSGAFGTVIFDWKATLHATRGGKLILTLGYNTAIFCAWYRICRIPNLINMDGIEWKRKKWSWPARIWLYVNERLGCWLGNHLIADHPEIRRYLCSRVSGNKISTISYGANEIDQANAELIRDYELLPNSYALVIARPEPENSILEIVSAFSRKKRGYKLVLIGHYRPAENSYHGRVIHAASSECMFPGAIYERSTVEALRYFCRLYIHGHRVGGTNPSLVEALGSSSPILAHKNKFNLWVAPGAKYFKDEEECSEKLDYLLDNPDELSVMKRSSRKRFREAFTWEKSLCAYEELFTKWGDR